MKFIKKRYVIAIILIIFASLSLFIGMKSVENKNKTIEVVKVVSNIRKGEVIGKNMITTTQIGQHNIPNEYVKKPQEVIGKYALADFSPEDFVLKEKIAETLPSAEEQLLNLDGNYEAISVSLKDFARGLSDKLIAGDIVSCKVTQENGTTTPEELTYLKVVTTTMPSGTDKQSGEKGEENLATVTLLATSRQAELLAEYDKKAEIHFSLVYRGDEKNAQVFLDEQTKVLNQEVVINE